MTRLCDDSSKAADLDLARKTAVEFSVSSPHCTYIEHGERNVFDFVRFDLEHGRNLRNDHMHGCTARETGYELVGENDRDGSHLENAWSEMRISECEVVWLNSLAYGSELLKNVEQFD